MLFILKMYLNKVINKLILISFVVCIFNYAISYAFNLTILHNNDYHSQYQGINLLNSKCKSGEQCFGGIARTVTKVNQIRDNNENVLFLNAGDHFEGSIWYNVFKWEVVAQFVKLMGHDIMALGNHEFDDGLEGLIPFVKNMSFNNPDGDNLPILSCNIESPELKNIVLPSIVKDINGTKIAIIGYTTPDTKFLSISKNITFNDEIESIKSEITKLKATHGESLNIFIAVGHSGFEKDKEIAQNITELDVVVGGHTNTFLYTGNPPSIEVPVDKYPVVFDHGMDGQTLVVQAFAFGKYLGELSVEFNDSGKIISYGGNPILLDESVAEDPEVLNEVKEVEFRIQECFGTIRGSTVVQLLQTNCRSEECNIGNLIADSYMHYFIEKTKANNSWTSVSIGVISGSLIRNSITVGNITDEDCLSATPFDNTIGVLKTNGSTLWQILEHSADQHKNGGFLQISGLRVKYDLSRSFGNRLVNVSVRCDDCFVPRFEDIDLSETYSIAMTDYMAKGGDNYTMIDTTQFTDYSVADNEVLCDYIQTFSPLFIGIEERIKFISS